MLEFYSKVFYELQSESSRGQLRQMARPHSSELIWGGKSSPMKISVDNFHTQLSIKLSSSSETRD